MGHEWKVGDWAEYRGARYLVVKAWSRGDCQFVNAYSGSGAVRTFSIGASNIKHLPECTGWEWEPPKPVEPTARKWEFGDWAHSPEGIVRFFFEKDGGGLCVSKDGRSHCFQFKYLEYLPDCTGFDWTPPSPVKSIEPLPLGDYRFLDDSETIEFGDIYLEGGEWKKFGASPGKMTVIQYLDTYRRFGVKAFARKIEPKPIEPPKGYRLMSDDETIVLGDMFWQDGVWNETGIFFSKITVKEAKGKYTRYCAAYARKIEPRYRPFANTAEFSPHRDKWLVDYDGDLVRVIALADEKLATSYGRISFEDAFNRYKFEDGTPFGVLDTKE